jgi:HK97 family phage portal protein
VGWFDRWVWSRIQNREALSLEQLLADEGTPTASGETVTTDQALRLSTVFGCVNLLADSVATLPLDVYRRGERTPLANTPRWLEHPSADFELHDWLYAAMASLLLRGNCYGLITDRAGAGLLPTQVDLANPDQASVTTDDNGRPSYRIGGVEQDTADVWHVKAYPFAGSLTGLSPIAYARESIGLGISAEKYGASFFAQNGMPVGMLSTEQKLLPKEARELKDQWEAVHGGKLVSTYPGLRPQRRGIAVLGGGAKFQPITIAPEEAQFVETQKANVATICRYYRVPPEMVGGETAGPLAYSSPEMRSTDLLMFALRPWLYRLERAVSRLLPRSQVARFNAGGFARVTLKERYEAHEIGIRSGWLLRSEVRELEDRPPIPGIDNDEPPEGAVA